MVRGKFECSEITTVAWSSTAKRYLFQAVSNDGTPEHQRFHRFTPTGRIELTIDNPKAQEQFVLGQYYYFDAIPAAEMLTKQENPTA